MRTGAWFAHAPGEDCANGIESALHLAAKQVLADERMLMLPSIGNLCREGLQAYESVRLEAAFTSPVDELPQLSFFEELLPPERQARLLRADAVCHIAAVSDSAPVEHWVEIFVHHQVDDEKRDRLRRDGKRAVEIDLRWMLGEVLTLDTVRAALQATARDRRWIAFPSPTPPLSLSQPAPSQAVVDSWRVSPPRPPKQWLGDGESTLDPELERLKARAQQLKDEKREREEARARRRTAQLLRKYGYD